MTQRYASRRCFFRISAALAGMTVLGCSNKVQQEAAGIGVAAAGSILVIVPVPIVQVVGCALIAGGTILIVEAKLSSGETRKIEVQLTEEQAQKLRGGADVILRDAEGRDTEVKPN